MGVTPRKSRFHTNNTLNPIHRKHKWDTCQCYRSATCWLECVHQIIWPFYLRQIFETKSIQIERWKRIFGRTYFHEVFLSCPVMLLMELIRLIQILLRIRQQIPNYNAVIRSGAAAER